VPAVDHVHISAQPDRMGAAGFGLAIGAPLVVEIVQDPSCADSGIAIAGQGAACGCTKRVL
jgi:hypothetical protein